MSKKFKLNQKVYDPEFGWGKIVEIHKDHAYPIRVQFQENIESFTPNGKYNHTDRFPTLSHKEYVRWEDKPKKHKKPIYDRIKVGDSVFCVSSGWGKVADTSDKKATFPIVVTFGSYSDSYTVEGKRCNIPTAKRILFKSERTVKKAKNNKEIKQ